MCCCQCCCNFCCGKYRPKSHDAESETVCFFASKIIIKLLLVRLILTMKRMVSLDMRQHLTIVAMAHRSSYNNRHLAAVIHRRSLTHHRLIRIIINNELRHHHRIVRPSFRCHHRRHIPHVRLLLPSNR